MNLLEYKKAGLKYETLKTFTAGVELFGTEVKSIRAKLGSLDGSRVVIRGGEAFISGMTIPPYQSSNVSKEYDRERTRRLLLTKREIRELSDAESKKGLTLVPLSMYNFHGLIKVKVAIVRGKGKADKREDIKKRDAVREAERTLKNH
ncbi:MAG TPA: SsrA-binding protein SmpB [Candidatus Kaiserbacteria bacterium]|nr:SsrA-binding protein SmpB [Candidatus Kaiserbacteria bacterium]